MAISDPIERLRSAVGGGAASSDFDLNADLRPLDRTLRPAAVLVAFSATESGLALHLTKRSSGLKHHPGQIALPGGKVDPSDRSLTETALREAEEEIGLSRDFVEVLGPLTSHETVTGFCVTPVLALVTRTFTPRPEAGEVEEAFTVPFDHVADPRNYLIESRYFRGVQRRFYVAPYGPYYIWGATARILYRLAERLAS